MKRRPLSWPLVLALESDGALGPLPARAAAVLLAAAWLHRRGEWIGQKTLSARSGLSMRTTRRALVELRAACDKTRNAASGGPNRGTAAGSRAHS